MSQSDKANWKADDDASLAARAAWLYFAGGKTQGEVADRLNVPSTKAHRLIARANREGLIRVFVEGAIAECVALEETLKAAYRPRASAKWCPTSMKGRCRCGRWASPARATCAACSITASIEIIGIGHGRTLAAAVDHLPRCQFPAVQFVSLLGGLTRKFAANPFDVIHRLAERTGGGGLFHAGAVLRQQRADKNVAACRKCGVSEVLAARAQGLAAHRRHRRGADRTGFLAASRHDPAEELGRVEAGRRLRRNSRPFLRRRRARRRDRTVRRGRLSPRVEDLRDARLVAIAGGASQDRGRSARCSTAACSTG